MNLKNKKVTVMGIGLHGGGVAMITWLSKQGARVVATDKKTAGELEKSLLKIKKLKNVEIVTGQHRLEDFTHADLVIKNPTVPWTNKYIKTAIENKVPVEMDSSLFMELCPTKNIIGVTGTKGKTTTSLVLAHILEEAGKHVVRVGIGQEAVMDKLAQIKKDSWVVFELSSWRLSVFDKIKKSPNLAIITNIFPDHLNYYSSMERYVLDKENIFKFQNKDGVLVANLNQIEYFEQFSANSKGKVVAFSDSDNGSSSAEGVFVEDGQVIFRSTEGDKVLFGVGDMALRGKHNLSNVISASTMAFIVGVSERVIKNAISTFSGVKHRLEYVGKKEGVAYYNDTTATTPESAIAGIDSFSRPIHLVCGGSNKKLDLRPLARKIAIDDSVVAIYMLKGEATESLVKLLKEFEGTSDKIRGLYDNMDGAVSDVAGFAKDGELALLSPGCASFGMFINEFDRGEKFKSAFENIKV